MPWQELLAPHLQDRDSCTNRSGIFIDSFYTEDDASRVYLTHAGINVKVKLPYFNAENVFWNDEGIAQVSELNLSQITAPRKLCSRSTIPRSCSSLYLMVGHN
jgi:hypothetical protein